MEGINKSSNVIFNAVNAFAWQVTIIYLTWRQKRKNARKAILKGFYDEQQLRYSDYWLSFHSIDSLILHYTIKLTWNFTQFYIRYELVY